MHSHDGNQCIHCTVSSCRHNTTHEGKCNLNSINVCPSKQVSSGMPDESKCDSYMKR